MNPGGLGESDLERRLERELARTVRSLRGPSPMSGQAAYHRFANQSRFRSLVRVLGAVLAKVVAGVAAAGLVAGGGVVAATGSTNPNVWGSTVTKAVATCRGSLPSGQHGIGPCIGATASQNVPGARAVQAAPTPIPGTAHFTGPAAVPTPATGAGSSTGDPGGHPALQPSTSQPPASQPADRDHASGPTRWPDPGNRRTTAGAGGMTGDPAPSGRPSTSRRGGSGNGPEGPNHSPSPPPSAPWAH